jgi:hypothetical protein
LPSLTTATDDTEPPKPTSTVNINEFSDEIHQKVVEDMNRNQKDLQSMIEEVQDGEEVLEIEEEDGPRDGQRDDPCNPFKYLSKLVQGWLGPKATADTSVKSDKNEAKQAIAQLRASIEEEVTLEVHQLYSKYADARAACKLWGLGGNGRHVDLKAKLTKHLTEERYRNELKKLEQQLKAYKPESDPEDAELHDLSTFARNYIDIP